MGKPATCFRRTLGENLDELKFILIYFEDERLTNNICFAASVERGDLNEDIEEWLTPF